jgi:hypothetical protein
VRVKRRGVVIGWEELGDREACGVVWGRKCDMSDWVE